MKAPPTKILLFGNIKILLTVELKPLPILKLLSIVPSEFSRIILLKATLLYDVNCPPTNILPSPCNFTERVVALNSTPILRKVVSIEASAFNLIILLAENA
ncbi:MAG: hypothetical protein DDT42_02076 [candidate division WS2 bacterium]|uniref:Uncharacterized protein n=1 Tax=Psychracetigena formicireducens TaxID=2986056 RepID=A0A9E2BIX9_PSYF1|nr:hypothetical protein [Candidatus Psychracetigena formicireducens]